MVESTERLDRREQAKSLRVVEEYFEQEEYQKTVKFCNQKLVKNVNVTFYNTMKAFSLLKLGKIAEIQDLLTEIKTQQKTAAETVTARYLIQIYNEINQNGEATQLLELVCANSPDDEEMAEELFYSYVREHKLLKQQNHALAMYKSFQKDLYS